MQLQKEEDKSNFQSQTYRIPSVLAYSFRLSLVLQIKGPAAKLVSKKGVGWASPRDAARLSISPSCPLAPTKSLGVPGATRSSDAHRGSPGVDQ